MKKTLFTILLFAGISGISFAQLETPGPKIHIGLSTAINSTFVLDQGLKTDPQYVTVNSFDMSPIGTSFGVDFSNKFGLQLEGIVANFTQVYNIVNNAQEIIGNREIAMQYLQLPLVMKFMSGGTGKARMNFMVGPQVNFLAQGQEIFEILQAADNISVPELAQADLPAGSTDYGDGTFYIPSEFSSEILSKNAIDPLEAFKNQELHIVGGFGLDLDVGPKLYISMLVRADYGITDMRNGDLIDQLQNKTLYDVTGARSNLAVGVQLSLNYMFDGVRSFLVSR
ncbi:MAG: PorT family protein [Cyclobacteriaceae bacterium]|nr:PorT family protein [Cyclobacteriaceae bacterium]